MVTNAMIPVPEEGFKVIYMLDGVVIQSGHTIHTLNSSAFEVFKLCDGRRTVKSILGEMHTRYPEINIDTMISEFIEQLNTSGLVKTVA